MRGARVRAENGVATPRAAALKNIVVAISSHTFGPVNGRSTRTMADAAFCGLMASEPTSAAS